LEETKREGPKLMMLEAEDNIYSAEVI